MFLYLIVFCIVCSGNCMGRGVSYRTVKASSPVKITRDDAKLLPPSLRDVANRKSENMKLENILVYKNSWGYANLEDFWLKFQHELNHKDNRAFGDVTEYIRGLQIRRRVYGEGDFSGADAVLLVLKKDSKSLTDLQEAGGEFLEKLIREKNHQDWQTQVEPDFIKYVLSVAKVWSYFFQFVNFFEGFSHSLELAFRSFYVAVNEEGYWGREYSKVDKDSYPNFEKIIYKMPWERLSFDSLFDFVVVLQAAISFQIGKIEELVKNIQNVPRRGLSQQKPPEKPRKVVAKGSRKDLLQGTKKMSSSKRVDKRVVGTGIPFAICCECARLAFDCSVVV